ncbi:MAG: DUF362 domain-containing protein [Tannerellaceae bacterium]|jgi:uncharacterized Fe-S center protein|nr:DUF362 domain-containing protein [Tannerellaceae bacterium]
MERRNFLKTAGATTLAIVVAEQMTGCSSPSARKQKQETTVGKSKVYMTAAVTPESLMAIYKMTGRDLKGKVAVKISTGEAGNRHYLSPDLIKNLVHSVSGTIVECNTAYEGKRLKTEEHRAVAEEHGFTAIAEVDIMDENGSISLPFPEGKHLREDFVGANFRNYDSWLVLSHFKGHQMAGFGGALKNISIGIGSSSGKTWIHSAGKTKNTDELWDNLAEQNDFVESMADAAGAVMQAVGDNVAYINVMNHLSIDCDCNGNPAPPELDDIGILASHDPVALDKACVDLVYAADTQRSASLRQRIEQQNGMLILTHAETLGLGSREYELINIDGTL